MSLNFDGAWVQDPPYTRNYGSRFLVMDRGRGVYVWDRLNRKYLDFQGKVRQLNLDSFWSVPGGSDFLKSLFII